MSCDIADPSNDIVDVLIQCMDWNIASRQSRVPEAELPELQEKAVAFLDLLQRNLPDKTVEKGKWNFEKAHSILHKVRRSSCGVIRITPRVKDQR